MPVNIQYSTNTRASYLPDGKSLRIHDTNFSAMIHEMGHHIENMNSKVRLEVKKFFKQRTQKEKLRPLSELKNVLHPPNEEAYADKFLDP